jgi:hypothetical protein
MRLVILLLALTALLSCTAVRLLADLLIEPQPITAERRGAFGTNEFTAKVRARDNDIQPIVAAPPLFRLAVAPAKPGPKPGENYVVVGIARRGSLYFGILRDVADGRIWSATPNRTVGPWTVTAVDSKCVRLRLDRLRKDVCV